AEEENVDHQRDQSQTGQRHQEVPQHQLSRDGVHAGHRHLEVQAADGLAPLADRGRDDPVVAVGRFDRDLVVVGPLELVVVFDAAKLVEFQVLTARAGGGNQVRLGAVQIDVGLSHAGKVVLDPAEDAQQVLRILERALVGQLVGCQSCLLQRLTINLLLHWQPGQPHGDVGRYAHHQDYRGGDNGDDLALNSQARERHKLRLILPSAVGKGNIRPDSRPLLALFLPMRFHSGMETIRSSYLVLGCLFLAGLCVLQLLASPGRERQKAQTHARYARYLVYVGTYTTTKSKGIYAYRFDADSGRLTSLGLVAETVNPSFLAVDPSRRFLYA